MGAAQSAHQNNGDEDQNNPDEEQGDDDDNVDDEGDVDMTDFNQDDNMPEAHGVAAKSGSDKIQKDPEEEDADADNDEENGGDHNDDPRDLVMAIQMTVILEL